MKSALFVGAVLAAGLATAPAASAATAVLYDTTGPVRTIARAGVNGPNGALHQAPARIVFGSRYRASKVNTSELTGQSAGQMASLLKQRIRNCTIRGRNHRCSSHVVFVDEITAAFNDRRGPGNGANLSAAMRMLNTESPYGGTWASRVHLYMAPNFGSAIAKGRGPNHNRGRDGKAHFPTWSRVMPALALAGGVWIEVYHQNGAPFTRAEFRNVGKDVWSLMSRQGGSLDRLHFLMSAANSRPAGAPRSCGGPMACQWKLADTGAINSQIVNNGVGAYRVGGQAGAWAAQYQRRVG